MQSAPAVRVSIGLPVYNGEKYLEETLDAILAQTFTDFELIIADNVSTDSTEEICRAYAAKDDRIRYSRYEKNLGPAWNHNRVFELSTGEYFKWAAHDDLIEPDLIDKCVEVLDQDPSVVLSHSMANVIADTECSARGKYDIQLNTDSDKSHERLFGLMFGDKKFGDHRCYQVYGLIRSAALKQTDVIGFYAHADGVLLVQLAFLGRFYKIPEYLFFPRYHEKQSTQIARAHYHLYTAWFDPSKQGKITFPRWKILFEYLKAISLAPATIYERAICYFYWLNWLRKKRYRLREDLVIAAQLLWQHWRAKRNLEGEYVKQ